MKYFLLLALLFSGCAASRPTSRPFDRSEQQKEYAAEEAVNQERSLNRSEWMARVKSLDSQIKAIDAQIKNQEDLIRKWKSQTDVASSLAMQENAGIRIRHLKEERTELEGQRKEAQARVSEI